MSLHHRILMKVTSRERPYKLRQCVEEYRKFAENTELMSWVFTFDEDDYQVNEKHYFEVWSSVGLPVSVNLHERTNKITAINSDVPETDWDILLNISDDQLPIERGYDNRIREAMPDHLNASLWFFDGWQRRINTQEIVGYNFYKRFGNIYPPYYKSFFCDNETTDRAGKDLIRINKCIIKHFHPGWDASLRGVTDDLYKANDKYWDEDKQTYFKRKAQNFGL